MHSEYTIMLKRKQQTNETKNKQRVKNIKAQAVVYTNSPIYLLLFCSIFYTYVYLLCYFPFSSFLF